ncbi:SH3 domain-containing protein [Aquimarina brevivitae]|uniref:SH3 domain-containing protein n=1 Tax=Aquimarina brevivitae TaxID=323412 RepID=A0A4Q7PFU2_9FLAO|nr:SH3 domain-containing protein [Aquimarina brevivitae]RZS99215.1 SH3 domain-containing protein [Aquimarina brevivitae]
MRHLLILILFLVSTTISAQEEDRFQKANQLYNQEQYQQAIATYKTILDSGKESAALYYNLANAYYKQSNIGPSIYYYEKALQLAPDDEDIQNNLAFAKNSTIDKIEVMPQGFIAKSIDKVTSIFSIDGWAWVSVSGVIFFVVLFLLYFIAASSVKKRLFFIGSWVFLGVALIAVIFAYQQYTYQKNNKFAIVFTQEANVKSEPNLRSEAIFQLHEGTKLQVTDTVNNWKKIKLADGKIGWIPSADIKEL